MSFKMTERFKRAYKKLDPTKQSSIKKAILKMENNINHPSLRVKRIQGTVNIWEASADLSIRLTFSRANQEITLRNCGEHDQTLKKP
jgi:mRNA interferase RelE/StbE